MQVARMFGSKQWPARVPIGWTLPSSQRRALVVAAHPSPPPGNPPLRSQPQHIGHTIEATTVLVASSWPISGSRVGRQQVGGGSQGALPSQRRPGHASVGLLGGGGFPCCPRRRRPPRASCRWDASDGVRPWCAGARLSCVGALCRVLAPLFLIWCRRGSFRNTRTAADVRTHHPACARPSAAAVAWWGGGDRGGGLLLCQRVWWSCHRLSTAGVAVATLCSGCAFFFLVTVATVAPPATTRRGLCARTFNAVGRW